MIIYLLKFTACLGIFWCFYKLFLEKESIHQFKRYYLLSIILVSIIIPFITFTHYVQASESSQNVLIDNAEIVILNTSTISYWLENLQLILWILYFIGAGILGLRFIFNLSNIAFKIHKNPKSKFLQFTNVLLSDLVNPHTFFNYIFLNKQSFESDQIPEEVILHEQTHAIQKHALDIIIIEMIQIVFWFNPLIFLIKKDIKLNHEFLADQAVLNKGIDPKSYQNLLLAFSSNAFTPQLANAINYSLIKKRFTVMKTNTSKPNARLKGLILLPLLAILVFGFSEREEIQIASKVIPIDTKFEEKPALFETYYGEAQKSASREQMKEYNKLAKKYNAMPKDDFRVKSEEVERMKYIYDLMSEKQRNSAEPFPNFPPPPPPPNEVEIKEAKIAAKVKYAQAREYKQQAKLARVAEMKENKAAAVTAKANYVKAKKEMESAKLAKIAEVKRNHEIVKAEKIKYVKEKEARKAEKIKYVKEREAVKAEKIKAVKLKNAQVKAEKAALAEIKEVRSVESPVAHIKRMTEKNAIFYFEGKKITSKKALKLVKENPELHIQTRLGHDKIPDVYISSKPIVVKEND